MVRSLKGQIQTGLRLPQLGRPYAGANSQGYKMEGWGRVVTRKPEAPPNLTPFVSVSPAQTLPTTGHAECCMSGWDARSLFYQVWYGPRGAGRPSQSIHTGSRMGSSTEYVWGQKPGLLQRRMKKNKTGLNLKKTNKQNNQKKHVDQCLWWGNCPEELWRSNYSALTLCRHNYSALRLQGDAS